MIIGVSPFSEAVHGKSCLESLESESYAILRGLRAARSDSVVATHCPRPLADSTAVARVYRSIYLPRRT